MRHHLMVLAAVCSVFFCPAAYSYEYSSDNVKLSLTGYLDAKAIAPFDRDTPEEFPTTELGLEYKTTYSSWSAVKLFIRGVDNGTVLDPQNGKLFEDFSHIYQDRNPYIDVNEAYVDFYSSHVDLRLGIQKFAWGRLDEINPTDNLNPQDFTQGGVNEQVERKIGVPAVKASTYSDLANVELVLIPRYIPYRLPTTEERWFPAVLKAPASIEAGTGIGSIEVSSQHNDIPIPAFTLRNSEQGIRVSKYIGGWDLSLSYYRGYDIMPMTEASTVMTVEFLNPLALSYDLSLDVTYEPVLDRIQVYGFDFTTTVSSFTVRGEYAYYRNKHYNRSFHPLLKETLTPAKQKEITDEFLQNYIASGGTATRQTFIVDPTVNIQMDSMKYGVGVDYIYGDTTISGQLIQEFIPDYDENKPVYFINDDGFNTAVTIIFKQFFLQNTMELNLSGAYGIEFREYAVKPSLKYSFTNTLQGTIGLIILGSKYDDSMFGQYDHNDEIYARLRCSF